ncbi:MAG TPA: S1 RNA-binding domain-containing protein [Acidimicrobiales bacterium]|nr:S1 RNA-binding domain-containing protein [Acidimicrobiales bacterium]
MAARHVVVDGSNLATEGRTLPSLQQLDEAVRAYEAEFAPPTVTVVVDASFPNRIDASERELFEGAIEAGEIITPPAGVIGRGDAFLLQIADRADAVVLSNDSFQEFHGTYGWLFDAGRLVGGKPVPHVGWVFMHRSPVRGPLSRRSVSDAKRTAKAAEDALVREAAADVASTKKKAGRKTAGKRTAAKAPAKKAAAKPAPARKAELAASPASDGGRRARRRNGSGAVEPYNDALPFIEFVSAHPVGSTVKGEVERFASHGAYVLVDGARCYLPLKHLADPPPRSAREVLAMGTPYKFVVHAFDTPRRGVDLTMPGVVPAGTASEPVHQLTEEARVAPARKKKAAAKKAPARKKAAAKKAPARKKAAAKRAPARKKAAARKAPARKKAAAKKAPARKKAAAKRAPARRKKAAAKKAPARKKAAAKRAPARRKSAAKRAPARKRAAKRR